MQGRSPYQAASLPSDERERHFRTTASVLQDGYVQRYTDQARPENPVTNELNRQSRRAQNDVLATVGACQCVDKEGNPIPSSTNTDMLGPSSARLIEEENNIGLHLLGADWLLFSLSNLCLLGLRQRLQVNRIYSEASFRTIVVSEWENFGYLRFLFAGTAATLAFRYLDTAATHRLRYVYNYLMRRFARRVLSPRSKKQLKMIMDISEWLIKLTVFATIAPLEILATLQRIHLIVVSPIFPRLTSLVALSHLTSAPPTASAASTLPSCVSMLLWSPLSQLWILRAMKQLIDEKLYVYLRFALPVPSNPDYTSVYVATKQELDNSHILGLTRTNVRELLAQDRGRMYRAIKGLGKNLTLWLTARKSNPAPALGDTQHSDLEGRNGRPQRRNSANLVEVSPSINSLVPRQDSLPLPSEHALDTAQRLGGEQSSERWQAAPIASDPTPELGGPLDDVFPLSTNEKSELDSQHRVTVLTAHLADTLAMHLSTHFTDLLFLPLEALFVRSVALNYLDTARIAAPLGPVARSHEQIIPLHSWLGGNGGRRGFRNYVNNLFMCGVTDLAISMGIWQLSSGIAWLLGRRRFGWGTL